MAIYSFYKTRLPLSFIIRNTSNKQIKVFNIRLAPGSVFDLMNSNQISEMDIKHNLTKGELLHRLENGDIAIVSSNIDLQGFESDYRDYLTEKGITIGVIGEPGPVGPEGPPPIPTQSEVVNISSTDHIFVNKICRVWVGTGGDVVLQLRDDAAVQVWKNVPSGSYIDGQVIKIQKNNTSASNMIGIVDTTDVI